MFVGRFGELGDSKMYRKRVFVFFFVLFLVSLSAIFIKVSPVVPSVCQLPEYENYHGDYRDLLIVRGRCVLDASIKAVDDRPHPKRLMIVSFLGNGGYKEALPKLVGLVDDENEDKRVRASALVAVFQIDDQLGRAIASNYSSADDALGASAIDILENEDYLHRRKSALEAYRDVISAEYAL